MNDTMQTKDAFLKKFNRSKKFYAYYPYPKFPSVSVTGKACAMNCKHCGRQYLKHMVSCPSPEELYRKCLGFDKKGFKGVLVSGGYNSNGWVPLESFVDVLARIKRETNLAINVHCGLVPDELACDLGKAGIDVISFDLIGADESIKEVIGIEKRVEDYERSLDALVTSVSSVVPHITIGLHGGKLLGEERALEIASSKTISALVFLVLVPTAGTAFEKALPPVAEEVGKLISAARLKRPDIPIMLGCMRPRLLEYEISALNAGVDGIVMPRQETLKGAKSLGLIVQSVEGCCAVPLSFGG